MHRVDEWTVRGAAAAAVRLLDGLGASRDDWLAAWERTGREPFAHPDYVSLFAGHGESAQAILWQASGDAEVLMPLIRRPLPRSLLLGARLDGDMWTDAVSPYGYGGPFASSDVDWPAFYADVLAWMGGNGVVSFFVRASLHSEPPLLADLPGYEAVLIGDNVVVDLTRTPDAQWAHYAHKVRKNVKKAQRAGLRVVIEPSFRRLAEFVDILHVTMHRRRAKDWYFFEPAFFHDLSATLGGGHLVAEVHDPNGRVVSAELVLRSDRAMYSFLGGTREEAFPFAANDLLKHAVIKHGHELGLDRFVLGGGYVAGDGIFRYKRSFDEDGVVPYYGVRLTSDPNVYAALCAACGARLQCQGVGDSPDPVYFPAYRDRRASP